MKKTISTFICLGAMILAFTACSDDTEIKVLDAPVVTLSPASVTLSAEAVESYTINYTVSSPGEGASVSATADASWVTVVDTSVSGQIRLSVGANASGEMRTATLTVTYSYDGGAVTAKAAVVQYGAGDPVLSVDPNAIVAGEEGGTYSFGYSVENSIEGEEVACTTDADWISGFDYGTYGTVSFDVEANSGELRSAVITVSYAGLEAEVDVVQDRLGTAVDIMFEITSGDIYAGYEGGEYSLSYRIKNPVEGDSVVWTADADWVSGFVDDGEGTVTFTVAKNSGEELRYATITADYDGITDSASVTQDYDSGEVSLVGTYTVTGDDYSGVGTWIMTIHEVTTTSGGPGGGTTTTAWYADGLTPTDAGWYDTYGYSYCAKITWTEGEDTFAIASQVTSLRSSGYYLGWTPCTAASDSGYSYSSQYPDLNFSMKNSITWETVDYGVFLGAWSSNNLRSTFSGFFDVVAPTFTITKISSDPDLDTSSLKQASASNAARPLDTLVPYLNFMVK